MARWRWAYHQFAITVISPGRVLILWSARGEMFCIFGNFCVAIRGASDHIVKLRFSRVSCLGDRSLVAIL